VRFGLEHECNVVTFDPVVLDQVRDELRLGSEPTRTRVAHLRKRADAYLKARLLRITDKKLPAVSGDPRDFFSFGTYWWPDPDQPDGLPWIRRDGQINPDSMQSDTGRVRKLCQRCWHLALAWSIFGDERYAKACAEQLQAWFLDPEHAMNPHLRYAQSIPGRVDGRSLGIIDTRDLRFVCDAASLILDSAHWSQDQHAELREWMGKLLDWLLTSKAGREENRAANNHGTWYSVQVLALALFSGRLSQARTLAEAARQRIGEQIDPDGKQPEEFARSRPLTYCTMNLNAFFDAASLAEAADVDLWRFQAENGASLEKAARWLLPYLQETDGRPEREIIRFEPENYLSVFRLAAIHYDEQFEPSALPIDQKRVAKSLDLLLYPVNSNIGEQDQQTMSDTGEIRSKIAAHWDGIAQRKRVRWWHNRVIIEEINRRVCGEPLPRISQGAMKLAAKVAGKRTFRRGVSVGGGSGSKEMALLKAGLVEHMTVYELSSQRIAAGRKAAVKRGLADRIEFVEADAFKADIADGQFDLVHWNNALHHMFDVDQAVAWSHRVLSSDGLFFMDDYVGPNRFQWSDETLALASRIRENLPAQYLERAETDAPPVPVQVGRPSIRRIVNEDPSEAPDSERIVEGVRKHFPNALIIPTGGAVYNLALTHTLHHFDPKQPADEALLRNLMLVDEMAVQSTGVESHYAVALAWRNGRKIKHSGPGITVRARPGQQNQPLWIRCARRILPDAIRQQLNGLNLARQKWLAERSVRAAKTPAPKPKAALEHQADPDGAFWCPVCDSTVTGFVAGGHHGRPGSKCPECGSLERHRAAWLYLARHADWTQSESKPVKLLHVAPEPPMERRFRALEHIDYLSADIEPGKAMVQMDLTAIEGPEHQYDVIFCSHVLEHIPDDHSAMKELYRVLNPGGTLYVQVPMRGQTTYEDASITAPAERRKAFGQEDHVRMYGTDILERLEQAGFNTRMVKARKFLKPEEVKRANTGNRDLIIAEKTETV
jgi:ubiquinone/menaquinone biosynthesis C-methylase UbiE